MDIRQRLNGGSREGLLLMVIYGNADLLDEVCSLDWVSTE